MRKARLNRIVFEPTSAGIQKTVSELSEGPLKTVSGMI